MFLLILGSNLNFFFFVDLTNLLTKHLNRISSPLSYKRGELRSKRGYPGVWRQPDKVNFEERESPLGEKVPWGTKSKVYYLNKLLK